MPVTLRSRPATEMTCARCGSYEMSPEADLAIRQLRPEERPLFSHWVYEQNRLGVIPTVIRVEDIPSIKTLRRFSYVERTRLLLAYLLSKTNHPGQQVDVSDFKLQALLQTFDLAYINYLIQYLYEQERYIQLVQPFHLPAGSWAGASTYVILTPQGIMQAEELSRSYTVSTQGFVAMWFDESLRDAWTNGFDPGIRTAGFRPVRIDKEDYIGGISDQIMAEIRRSRFVVADYTGQRNGVYFEAAFALGLSAGRRGD